MARLRAAAQSLFLALPGWRGALDRAARAAAAAAAAATAAAAAGGAGGSAAEGGGGAAGLPGGAEGGAGGAAAAAAAAAGGGVFGLGVLDAVPLVCSRERLRDLLDSNVLDFVDGRNLEQVGRVWPYGYGRVCGGLCIGGAVQENLLQENLSFCPSPCVPLCLATTSLLF